MFTLYLFPCFSVWRPRDHWTEGGGFPVTWQLSVKLDPSLTWMFCGLVTNSGAFWDAFWMMSFSDVWLVTKKHACKFVSQKYDPVKFTRSKWNASSKKNFTLKNLSFVYCHFVKKNVLFTFLTHKNKYTEKERKKKKV